MCSDIISFESEEKKQGIVENRSFAEMLGDSYLMKFKTIMIIFCNWWFNLHSKIAYLFVRLIIIANAILFQFTTELIATKNIA